MYLLKCFCRRVKYISYYSIIVNPMNTQILIWGNLNIHIALIFPAKYIWIFIAASYKNCFSIFRLFFFNPDLGPHRHWGIHLSQNWFMPLTISFPWLILKKMFLFSSISPGPVPHRPCIIHLYNLNTDGQQLHQHQQNEQPPLTSTHWTQKYDIWRWKSRSSIGRVTKMWVKPVNGIPPHHILDN